MPSDLDGWPKCHTQWCYYWHITIVLSSSA